MRCGVQGCDDKATVFGPPPETVVMCDEHTRIMLRNGELDLYLDIHPQHRERLTNETDA
jgi:hypothetical protein